ncbi:hypothetical protein GCM10010174_70200 [Kutzneria viridogrisea]|uniref:Minor tail protein n=1 Tax=Kutzneria viridogrisea TaxID=47990 RepID=A0ABR6BAV4_9PSEU|nr:hypothetical protein [Kutzneria viridogrisea]
MADRNPLWVSDTGGVVTIDDARIGDSALWTPGSSNVSVRKGLRVGSSSLTTQPGLVAQQTVADKTIKIQPFQAVIPASRGTGSYVVTLDAVKNIDLLTSHPAHGSLQTNHLIVAQVSDKTWDSVNGFNVIPVWGTPSGTPTDPTVNTTNGATTNSPDYITLARIRVPANALTITASMIDDLRPPWMVALGGLLPIKDATDRATLTPYDGMGIWRIDRRWAEVYSIAAGGWLVQSDAVCSSTADRDAAITTPYDGQMAYTTDARTLWVRRSTTWQALPYGRIGGSSATSQVAGIVAETVTDSITFTAIAGRRYKLTANFGCFSSAAGDQIQYQMRWQAGSSLTTSGTLFQSQRDGVKATSTRESICMVGEVTGITAGTATIGLSLLRSSGTGTITRDGSAAEVATLILEDVGV